MALESLHHFMPLRDWIRLKKLLTEKPRSTDRDWNMLSLSPPLHRMLGAGLIALVWLRSLPASPDAGGNYTHEYVELQIRSISRLQEVDPKRHVDISGDLDHLRQRLMGSTSTQHPSDSHLNVSHTENSRRILSGTTVRILVRKEDVPKMKMVVDLMWLLLRLEVLSGAASPQEFDLFDDEPPSPDPVANPDLETSQKNQEKVSKWLGKLPATPEKPTGS